MNRLRSNHQDLKLNTKIPDGRTTNKKKIKTGNKLQQQQRNITECISR